MKSWSTIQKFAIGSTAGLAVLGVAPVSHAIVINNTVPEGRAEEIGAPFTGVVEILLGDSSSTHCTGALINSSTLITAQHCTGRGHEGEFIPFMPEDFTINFFDEDQDSIFSDGIGVDSFESLVEDPQVREGRGGEYQFAHRGEDISILNLTHEIPDITPFNFLDSGGLDLFGQEVLMSGFGVSSDGQTSYIPGMSSGRPIMEIGSPNVLVLNQSDDVRRGARNTIEGYISPGDLSENDVLYSEFDWSASEYDVADEGMTTFGDSGGPLLIEQDGEYLIAGITSFGGLTRPIRTPFLPKDSYAAWVDVAQHQDFLEKNGAQFISFDGGVDHPGIGNGTEGAESVPEPSYLISLGILAAIGFGAKSRQKQMAT